VSLCTFLKSGLSPYQTWIDSESDRLKSDEILNRMINKDHTVWQSDPAEISNRLGWLDIADRMQSELEDISHFVNEVKADGFEQVLLLGMGGSSLAPELFAKIFGTETPGGLDLRILDSTDPEMVLNCQDWAGQKKTLFIVSSKSGGTAETHAFFKFFYTWIHSGHAADAGSYFTVITDPGSQLEQTAKDLSFRKIFLNDPNIGGRFSALSFFGLVPAALSGVDLVRLLESVQSANWDLGFELGIIMGILALKGRDKLTFLLSPQIQSFGDWVEQLIAESTGKNGQGVLPVIGESLLESKAYGSDRLFIYLKLSGDTGLDSRFKTLAQAGHPVITLVLDNIYQLGEQFFVWELATAVSGILLKINPFDQPNVESAKVAARSMISAYLESGTLPEPETAALQNETLSTFLNQAKTGDYLSVQAYIPMTADSIQDMQKLQSVLQQRTGLPVTTGFGPRFLHSTGQLHKGDSGQGLFIQLTCDPVQDAMIPNAPGDSQSDMSFHVLKTAQAMGDYQALKNEKRRVIHFHLSGQESLQTVIDLSSSL
jgi:transaldolase / glucose-6-phosphate isomerase